ncbi:uncharacterized protein DNG_05275 [Cephalotrichum gorgonifer]|uniref:MARVEL domain-containing protein n=1 Tax=Cephalotrichum gorgonifer TaxID=2041049 RepID=A0AAE8MY14_9PEZI|nr:uncharacterized protein DNG_05275 [Cephalotrichum gorgonifer]
MPVEQGDLYWEKRSVIGFPLRAILRALQCTFALATAVLYGLDLASATDRRVTPGSGWIYAEVVSGLSLLGCLSHLVFTMTKCRWSLVDWVIFILWVAQFGVFGTIFLGSPSLDRGGSYSDHNRMLAAVWVDMVNMLLWFASGCISLVKCCAARRHQKQQRDTINMKKITRNRHMVENLAPKLW